MRLGRSFGFFASQTTVASNQTYLDKRQFDQALREYIPTTKKSLAQISNERGTNVAFRWQFHIPKADKAKIERELGVTRQVVVNRKGKSSNKRTVKPVKFVYALVNARQAAKGEEGLTGSAMEKAARNFIASRVRSIAFFKAGCIPIIKKLARAAKKFVRFDRSAKQYGVDKGDAIPARESFTPSCTLINSATGNGTTGSRALLKYGLPALQKAMNEEAQELLRHTHAKLQKDADKINAK